MAMKVYGASTAGVRNGSMGFDEETLEPTYVLRLGAPGKSAGLDIASRLGLDPALIEAARARMTTAERDVSPFLAELHAKLDALEQERRRDRGAKRSRWRRGSSRWSSTGSRSTRAKIREVEQRAAQLAAEFEQQRASDHRGVEPESARSQSRRPSANIRKRWKRSRRRR